MKTHMCFERVEGDIAVRRTLLYSSAIVICLGIIVILFSLFNEMLSVELPTDAVSFLLTSGSGILAFGGSILFIGVQYITFRLEHAKRLCIRLQQFWDSRPLNEDDQLAYEQTYNEFVALFAALIKFGA